jgi:hypothetical protein
MRRFSSSFRLAPTTLAFVVTSLRKRSLSFLLLAVAACVATAVIMSSYWTPSSHAEVNAPAAVRKVAPDFRSPIRLNQGAQKIAPNAKSVTKALSVATADLDNDGVPDLVTGYGTTRGTGSVIVQRGNPDAYAPKDEAMLQRIQQGYDPPSLLPGTKTYELTERIDVLDVADLNADGNLDVLAGETGGGLYILMGSGNSELVTPQRVNVAGDLTGLAVGEFGKPDGNVDIAVAVHGPSGSQVLIFDGAAGGIHSTPAIVSVPEDARDLAFSNLDGDKFSDLAFVSGTSVDVVRGQSTLSSGMVAESVKLPFAVETMSVGDFLNDRKAISEITVLTIDGTLQLLRRSDLDTRPYTPEEQAERFRNRLNTRRDPETPASSEPVEWMVAGQIDSGISPSAKLHAAHVSTASTEDLFVLGDSAKGTRMMISDFTGKGTSQLPDGSLAISRTGFSMLATGSPMTMASFRQKANGNRDLVVIDPNQDSASIVPLAATNISVDRTDDPVAVAAACTGAANDCSLRGAIQFANVAGNIPATINLPANTYSLAIDGTAEAGLCGSPNTGDLDLSGDGTTILGAGASITFIKGTTPNDRVMCVDAPLLGSFDFTMSGVTVSGGRDTTGVGAGGIVSGGANDVTTLNAVVLTNNRTQGGGSPVGAGLGNGRGSATVTNSTIGGTVTVASCANQAATNCGNQSQGSGAGIYMDVNADANKTFILSNSVLQNNNTTGGNGAGLITSSAGGSYATKSITNSSFLSNTAPGAGALGGGTYNESGGTMTINGTTYVGNSAAGFGGAVASANGAGHNTNINFARFVSNTSPGGSTLRGGAGSVMTATDCWWASNTGPVAGAISEDNAADENTPSFLVLRATPSPSSILLNQNSTFTANFLTDSNSAAVTASNLFSLAGVPVTWSNPQKGTLSNQVNAIRTVVNINSISEAGATVTVTTSTNHGFSNGQTVTIRGVAVPGYDGIFTITGITANTFTYTNTATGLGSSSGGTATVPFGDASATYTSGSVSASCGTGSVDIAVDGVTITPTIINQCPDLTVAKTNNVANVAVVGQTWTWTQTITNASGAAAAAANFTNGQVILSDNLPNSIDINYTVTTPSIVLSGVNSGTVNCAIDGNKDLSCTASGAVTIGVGGTFQVQWTAKANVVGPYANPRAGGSSAVDPNNLIVESNEGNNTSSNTVTVNKAATTTTITNAATLSSTPTVVGEAYAVNWSVTVNAPGSLGAALTGNVTVTDGSANCTAAVSAGTCNLTSTTAGAKTITATYAGDTNYLGSTSANASHTVNKADTTTTITNAATLGSTPTVVGQTYAVNWSVTVNPPGSVGAALTGNVTVTDGAANCTAAVSAGTCNITSTTAGAKTITATYAGDTNYNGSTSAGASHTVNKADTTTTITNAATLNSTPTVVGQSYAVNWSVTVNAPGSLGAALTGNVTVSDGSANCTAAVSAGTCSITSTTAGAKTITATYAGDTNYNGSTSAGAPHTVNKANTTTTITNAATLNSTPTVVGQSYAVNWSVAVSAPGSLGAALTGNVTVSDGTDNCTAAVSAGTCNLVSTTAGAKSITATYAGDSNYNGSTSAGAPHTVNAATTTTTITSDAPDPSNPGQLVTVNWTVVANAPGAGTPTGNVNVTVSGGAETCTAAASAGGCSLVLNTLGVGRIITATYVGNANFATSSDTESHDVVAANPNISVQDARVAEPTSGTTTMLFTVSLSAPAPAGGTTVDYATAVGGANPATPGSDYVAIPTTTLTFAAGQQIKTIAVTINSDADNAETDETLLLNLSNPTNGVIVRGQATGTITTANTPGTFLISEFRTSGPGGPDDDFIELYNNTDTPLTVAASDASAGYGVYKKGVDCDATPVLVATIPNGTVLPARGHYLVVGSSYSLGAYAAGNLTMSQNLEADTNVAVFSTANPVAISSVNRLDAVGSGPNIGAVCDLLREGTNLAPVGATTTEYSYQRDQCGKGGAIGNFGACTSSTPVDSNNNAADFQFGDTQGTFIAGVTQKLGAPGPENMTSPILRNSGFTINSVDPGAPASGVPNRVRDLTSNPGNNSTFGTLSIRRAFINNTGGNVTRLRFRIIDMTTFPTPAGIADLRALSSTQVIVNLTGGGNATVEGTTLETPPAQPNGGGINSSMNAGTVTLGTPLANGQTLNLQFLLGVQQTGSFRFYINVEALP